MASGFKATYGKWVLFPTLALHFYSIIKIKKLQFVVVKVDLYR